MLEQLEEAIVVGKWQEMKETNSLSFLTTLNFLPSKGALLAQDLSLFLGGGWRAEEDMQAIMGS